MADEKGTNSLPVVDIAPARWFYDDIGIHGELDTPGGTIKLGFTGCRRPTYLVCTGKQETMIAFGLVRSEWLPGMPGNGHTANSVVFDGDRPQVVVGNIKGLRKRPRINVSAWGYIERTVEVRIPITPEHVQVFDAVDANFSREEVAETVVRPIAGSSRPSLRLVWSRPEPTVRPHLT